MIDVTEGRLALARGGVLDADFNAARLRESTLVSAVRPYIANPPWHTLTAQTELADGIPVGMTLIFHHERLAQVSFRFAYPPEVTEEQVHEQHALWLERTLGPGPYVYEWGTVELTYDPRIGESAVVITWRGVSDLHDSVMPWPTGSSPSA